MPIDRRDQNAKLALLMGCVTPLAGLAWMGFGFWFVNHITESHGMWWGVAAWIAFVPMSSVAVLTWPLLAMFLAWFFAKEEREQP